MIFSVCVALNLQLLIRRSRNFDGRREKRELLELFISFIVHFLHSFLQWSGKLSNKLFSERLVCISYVNSSRIVSDAERGKKRRVARSGYTSFSSARGNIALSRALCERKMVSATRIGRLASGENIKVSILCACNWNSCLKTDAHPKRLMEANKIT